MIITCKSCQGKFRLPDERHGIKFRCKKCKGVIDTTDPAVAQLEDAAHAAPAQEAVVSAPPPAPVAPEPPAAPVAATPVATEPVAPVTPPPPPPPAPAPAAPAAPPAPVAQQEPEEESFIEMDTHSQDAFLAAEASDVAGTDFSIYNYDEDAEASAPVVADDSTSDATPTPPEPVAAEGEPLFDMEESAEASVAFEEEPFLLAEEEEVAGSFATEDAPLVADDTDAPLIFGEEEGAGASELLVGEAEEDLAGFAAAADALEQAEPADAEAPLLLGDAQEAEEPAALLAGEDESDLAEFASFAASLEEDEAPAIAAEDAGEDNEATLIAFDEEEAESSFGEPALLAEAEEEAEAPALLTEDEEEEMDSPVLLEAEEDAPALQMADASLLSEADEDFASEEAPVMFGDDDEMAEAAEDEAPVLLDADEDVDEAPALLDTEEDEEVDIEAFSLGEEDAEYAESDEEEEGVEPEEEKPDRSLKAYCSSCYAHYRLPQTYAGRTRLKCALCQEWVVVLEDGQPYPEPSDEELDAHEEDAPDVDLADDASFADEAEMDEPAMLLDDPDSFAEEEGDYEEPEILLDAEGGEVAVAPAPVYTPPPPPPQPLGDLSGLSADELEERIHQIAGERLRLLEQERDDAEARAEALAHAIVEGHTDDRLAQEIVGDLKRHLPPVEEAAPLNPTAIAGTIASPGRRKLFEKLAGKAVGDLYFYALSSTRVDVGTWLMRPCVAVMLVRDMLVLFAPGRKELVERMPLDTLQNTIWNPVTHEVVFAPAPGKTVRAVHLAPEDGRRLVSLILHFNTMGKAERN